MLTYSYHFALLHGFTFRCLFSLVRGIQRNDIRVDRPVSDIIISMHYSYFILLCATGKLVIVIVVPGNIICNADHAIPTNAVNKYQFSDCALNLGFRLGLLTDSFFVQRIIFFYLL